MKFYNILTIELITAMFCFASCEKKNSAVLTYGQTSDASQQVSVNENTKQPTTTEEVVEPLDTQSIDTTAIEEEIDYKPIKLPVGVKEFLDIRTHFSSIKHNYIKKCLSKSKMRLLHKSDQPDYILTEETWGYKMKYDPDNNSFEPLSDDAIGLTAQSSDESFIELCFKSKHIRHQIIKELEEHGYKPDPEKEGRYVNVNNEYDHIDLIEYNGLYTLYFKQSL